MLDYFVTTFIFVNSLVDHPFDSFWILLMVVERHQDSLWARGCVMGGTSLLADWQTDSNIALQ